MFSTTFKRPFVTLAVVSGLLIAAAPASAGSHQAATDGTSNTLTYAVVADSDRGQTPSGFSWSETQTGSAKTADANGFVVDGPFSVKSASGSQIGSAKTADAAGFVVDGPYSVKSASRFSWSETQTGSAKTAGMQGGGADANGFLVDGPYSAKPVGTAFVVDGPLTVKPATQLEYCVRVGDDPNVIASGAAKPARDYPVGPLACDAASKDAAFLLSSAVGTQSP